MRNINLILRFIFKQIIKLKNKIKFLNIICEFNAIINKIINLKFY